MIQENPDMACNTNVIRKAISEARNWCFTLNNYTENEIKQLKNDIPILCAKFVVGIETGENGTPHLQGYIKLHKKKRPFALGWSPRIHWELAKKGWVANNKYCSKGNNILLHSDNYIDGKLIKPIKTLNDDQLFDWEKNIINIIKNEPDDRTIYWFWEPNGCSGKTSFCKYLYLKYGAIPIEGRKNDILYCAACFESDIYVIDLERSLENYVSYAAIEKIKNGFYMCSKYESKPICRNNPHVIIFANFEPDYDKLSIDRWKTTNISSGSPS